MDIVQALYNKGIYDLEAVFPYNKGSASDWFEERGLPVYICHYGLLMQDLSQPDIKRVAKIPLFAARHLRASIEADRLTKELRGHGIDIVYTNTSSVLFGGMLARRLSARQIWHVREFRVLDHGFEYYLGEKRLKKYISKNADIVLTVSQAVKDYHADAINPDKMFVTYNSYPKSFINPKDKFNTDKPLNLLLAGDIKPGKGQIEAIEALKIAREKGLDLGFTIHLAGAQADPTYSNKLREIIERYGLNESVVFHGFVKDMQSLRKQMDIGLVSSISEAFGRTMIEGMLSELAMVGRDSGGTSEQIRDGETGLLYDGTVEDLAEKYLTLDGDRILLRQLACSGFEDAKRFTDGYAIDVTEQAIKRVIDLG
ncbi:glycosyltransferase family 4 protein [Collinsella tanakaei]|nr:glycosyltransferase family 4 protein [Collinsella tanakaei]